MKLYLPDNDRTNDKLKFISHTIVTLNHTTSRSNLQPLILKIYLSNLKRIKKLAKEQSFSQVPPFTERTTLKLLFIHDCKPSSSSYRMYEYRGIVMGISSRDDDIHMICRGLTQKWKVGQPKQTTYEKLSNTE